VQEATPKVGESVVGAHAKDTKNKTLQDADPNTQGEYTET